MAHAGSVYLVTGASRGIGREYVNQLLHQGARVIATARSADKSQGLQDLRKDFPDNLFTVPLDISDTSCIKVKGKAELPGNFASLPVVFFVFLLAHAATIRHYLLSIKLILLNDIILFLSLHCYVERT